MEKQIVSDILGLYTVHPWHPPEYGKAIQKLVASPRKYNIRKPRILFLNHKHPLWEEIYGIEEPNFISSYPKAEKYGIFGIVKYVNNHWICLQLLGKLQKSTWSPTNRWWFNKTQVFDYNTPEINYAIIKEAYMLPELYENIKNGYQFTEGNVEKEVLYFPQVHIPEYILNNKNQDPSRLNRTTYEFRMSALYIACSRGHMESYRLLETRHQKATKDKIYIAELATNRVPVFTTKGFEKLEHYSIYLDIDKDVQFTRRTTDRSSLRRLDATFEYNRILITEISKS